MKKIKVFVVVLIIFIVTIMIYVISNNFGMNNKEIDNRGKTGLMKNNLISNNEVSEKVTNTMENDNQVIPVETSLNVIETINDTNETESSDNDITKKEDILTITKTTIQNVNETNEEQKTNEKVALENFEKEIVTAKSELQVILQEEPKDIHYEENNVNDTQDIIEITQEQEYTEEIREEEKTDIKEEINTSEESNKAIAKEKMLNSILQPITNVHRQNGKYEFKYNKEETLRAINDIIDESFNSEKLWNGYELLYKIKIEYIEEIMQYSMYWPYKYTAIVTDVRNKNENGIFYVWAEDYLIDSQKMQTQYCIR